MRRIIETSFSCHLSFTEALDCIQSLREDSFLRQLLIDWVIRSRFDQSNSIIFDASDAQCSIDRIVLHSCNSLASWHSSMECPSEKTWHPQIKLALGQESCRRVGPQISHTYTQWETNRQHHASHVHLPRHKLCNLLQAQFKFWAFSYANFWNYFTAKWASLMQTNSTYRSNCNTYSRQRHLLSSSFTLKMDCKCRLKKTRTVALPLFQCSLWATLASALID